MVLWTQDPPRLACEQTRSKHIDPADLRLEVLIVEVLNRHHFGQLILTKIELLLASSFRTGIDLHHLGFLSGRLHVGGYTA